MHHVFISYSRADRAWVDELQARLQRRGLATWIDRRDIAVTVPWLDEVQRAITAAKLFVMCNSPASHVSTMCTAEARFAMDAGKRGCLVTVGGELDVAVAEVVRAAGAVPFHELERTELAVRARDWEDAGSPRGALVGRPTQQRLYRSARLSGQPLTPTEGAFLRASRGRTSRRRVAGVVVGLIAVAGMLGQQMAKQIPTWGGKENEKSAAFYLGVQHRADVAAEDPIAGLAAAAKLGGDEAALNAELLQSVLRAPTPDDGFVVPARAKGVMAPTTEAGSPTVRTGDGRAWTRRAGTVRRASPRATPAGATGSSLSFAVSARSGTVVIRRSGRLWRRVRFSETPTALRFSPNRREIAAAVGREIQIADLDIGVVRTRLVGAKTPIADLSWTGDGRRIWAVAGRTALTWPVRDGQVVVDEAGALFQAVLPSARRGAVWVVDAAGDLREIDLSTHAVRRRIRTGWAIATAAGDSAGHTAAVADTGGRLWLVSLKGRSAPRRVPLKGCPEARAAFVDAETLVYPCQGHGMVWVSVARAQVIRRVATADVFSVRPMPGGPEVLAGTVDGRLIAIVPGGRQVPLWKSNCNATILRISVSPNGQTIVPVGNGTGLLTCAVRLTRKRAKAPVADAGSWQSYPVASPAGTSVLSQVGATSRDGRTFIYTYSDGTIVLHPTANLVPAQTITSVNGVIRDALVMADDHLVVVTAAGVVQDIPVCGGCLSNRAMARLAGRRLAQYRALVARN